ncbi:hypothetical protein [Sphingomonas sp. PR090111-T3T-6A]|uniref:terminase small subunit-like protein n=1 Tax=Sphingomonas sp. PR090111-T3T-6A TaxID=685778 RepID=UPI00036CC207|nr:hypothetical protein [Sphingomonas sp. PR090111-T3T-6A]
MTENADLSNIQLSLDLGDLDPLLERIAGGESLLRVCRDFRMSFKGFLRLADDDPAFAARLEQARERGMDVLRERREEIDGDVLKTLSWIVRRRLGASAG